MKTIRVKPILVPYNIQEIQPKDCIGKMFLNENKIVTILNDLEDIIKSNAYLKAIPQQLILISLEDGMIKVGDKCLVKWGVDISGKDLYEVSTCTKIGVGGIHYFDEMSMCFGQHEIIDKIKKIISTQDKLSPELIQQLVDEYNNGGMRDLEIEMEEDKSNLCDCYYTKFCKSTQLAPGVKCRDIKHYILKLTNGFVTVVGKDTCDKCSKDCKKTSTITGEFGSCEEFTKSIIYTEEEVLKLLDKLLNIDCSFTKEDNSKCIIVNDKAFTLQEWFNQNKKK